MDSDSTVVLHLPSKCEFYMNLFRTVVMQDFDCRIIVEGSSIPCHRLIMIAVSPKFARYFSSKNANSEMVIQSVKQEDARDLVRYIYTGLITIEASRLPNFKEILKSLEIIIPIYEMPVSPKKPKSILISTAVQTTEVAQPIVHMQTACDSLILPSPPPVPRSILKCHDEVEKKDSNILIPKPFLIKTEIQDEPMDVTKKEQRRISFCLKKPAESVNDLSQGKLSTVGAQNELIQLQFNDSNANVHQAIDPTKIIKKRSLRPNRKVNYVQMVNFTSDFSDDGVKPTRCKYCNVPYLHMKHHIRVCKFNPNRNYVLGSKLQLL